MNYKVKALTGEEEDLIKEKIHEYAYTEAPPEPGTPEEERLVFRIAGAEGKVIAG